MKTEYDLIVSLGANCSVAHNLRFRGLRPVSLPFDWCYFVDDVSIHFWIDEVGHGFPGLLKREPRGDLAWRAGVLTTASRCSTIH